MEVFDDVLLFITLFMYTVYVHCLCTLFMYTVYVHCLCPLPLQTVENFFPAHHGVC